MGHSTTRGANADDAGASTRETKRRSKDVADGLRARIQREEFAIGRFLPTERELQDHFGASRATIRKALGQIVEEGYAQAVPNRGVIALRPKRTPATNRICLLEGGMFVTRVLTVRMGEMLADRGYQLDHPVCTPQTNVEEQLERALEAGYAGAIVWLFRGFPDQEALARISAKLPIVALDHPLPGATTDRLTFDHRDAARRATAHLIAQGCRRIAITGMFDMMAANHDRFSGYLQAHFDHGLQPLSSLFAFSRTSGMPEFDVATLHRLLESSEPPDGIVVMQDDAVPAVVSTALNLGLRLPQDLKLVSLTDDSEVSIDGIGLTGVAQDWDAVVLRACEMLAERISSPHLPSRTELLPQRLVVRGLCGAPESEWDHSPDPITALYGDPRFVRSRYQYSSLQRP